MSYRFFSSTVLGLSSLLAAAFLTPQAAFGCASCGCSLSSMTADWDSEGYSTSAGWKMDIIYNLIDQHQLRHGSSKISAQDVPIGQELESYTHNNYITLGLDYDFNPNWGVTLRVPFIVRDHATLGEEHDEYDTSRSSSIGDMSLIAHYQGFMPNHNFGVELGLKFPTGSFTDTFRDGEALDRGLEPGTGTTDIIAGVYYFDSFSPTWSYFGEATVQTALDSRDQYKPGTAENVTLGVRYTGWGRWIPQFQINGRYANRDTGLNSDNFDSGGTLLYLSPGITFQVTPKAAAYAFIQVPVYQNVNGYQLAPTWTLTAGIRVTF